MNKSLGLPLIILGFFLLLATVGPSLAPHLPTDAFDLFLRQPPSLTSHDGEFFFLGTDDLGRDVLSRLVYGARVSLGIGFLVVVISLVLGTGLGLLAGLCGGLIESVVLRGVDILLSLPALLIAVIVVALLGPSLINTIFAVSLVGLPGFVRIVRASALAEKAKPYVEAVHSFGMGPWRLAFHHILPNCLGPIFVQATFAFSDGILNAAALGFLGLGAQPPTPEWGVMLSDGRSYLESSWWLVTLPGLCILTVVLVFNLIGDRLQQILFPRKRI